MENHVCVGTCFSYTVPQTEPETPGDEMLDYCDSCQDSESHWTTVSQGVVRASSRAYLGLDSVRQRK